MGSLLSHFDIDCAAICYDMGSDKVLATMRAKRAFEYGANIVDTSRFSCNTSLVRIIALMTMS